jgi:copper(I)-binding protein
MKYLILFIVTLQVQAIEISKQWVKATPPAVKMSAAYMTIKNTSPKDVYLTHVITKIAEYPELHTHTEKDGVMRMRQVKKILVKANSITELKPKSFHVMLIQLTKKLKVNDKVKLELVFSDGAKKSILAPVKKM